MSPKFVPLFGDFKAMEVYQNAGRFIGDWVRETCTQGKLYSYSWVHAGMQRGLSVNNPAVYKEFQSLVPTHIDREAIDNSGFGRVGATGGVSQLKTSDKWKGRRD